MRNIFLFFGLIFSLAVQAQSTDATIKTNNHNFIRDARTIIGVNEALVIDQLIDSKVSVLAPRLLTTSTPNYVWTASDNLGNGSWLALPPSVSNFQSLTDGPGSFTSHSLNYSRVNAGTTALEYRTPAQVLLDISGTQLMIPTSVKTGNYTASPYDIIPCDVSGGSFTVTLPTAPSDKTKITIKIIATSGSNVVNLALGGSDVFNKAGGPTSGSIKLLNQATTFQYQSSTGIWYAINDDLPLSQIDLRYLQITNNLSDLASASTARTNLGLGSLATLNSINNSNWIGTALAHSNIAATAVTPGSYTNATITVAADGSITAATNGSGGGGNISGSGNANEIAYFTATQTIASLAVATYPNLTELSYWKGATKNATSFGFPGSTAITGLTRVTSLGISTGSAVGQDNFYAGASVVGGSSSGSFNVFIGSQINNTSLTAALSSSILMGVNIQPSVSNSIALLPGGGNIRTQNAVLIGHNFTLPASGTWTGTLGASVLIGNSINASNTTPTTKKDILIGTGIDISAQTNTVRPIIISADPTINANNIQNSIGIGGQVVLNDGQPNMVIIGQGAKGYLDATYGTTGGFQVAIGNNAFAGSWRATALGGTAQALGLSTTALGYGSFASASHGSSLGRGAYNPNTNSIVIGGGGVSSYTYYLTAVSSSFTNPAIPETTDISTQLNAGTSYSYIRGTSGIDLKPVPTLTNVRGGNVRIAGGFSTGTAIGGSIEFATTPAGGASNNTENAEVIMLKITGDSKMGFFAAASSPVVSQSVNTILVNNVTSGGTLSTIVNYTDLSIYANDAAAIRNNFFRLSEKVLKLETALRNLGFTVN